MLWNVKLMEIRSVAEVRIEAPDDRNAINWALQLAKDGAVKFIESGEGEFMGMAVPAEPPKEDGDATQ